MTNSTENVELLQVFSIATKSARCIARHVAFMSKRDAIEIAKARLRS